MLSFERAAGIGPFPAHSPMQSTKTRLLPQPGAPPAPRRGRTSGPTLVLLGGHAVRQRHKRDTKSHTPLPLPAFLFAMSRGSLECNSREWEGRIGAIVEEAGGGRKKKHPPKKPTKPAQNPSFTDGNTKIPRACRQRTGEQRAAKDTASTSSPLSTQWRTALLGARAKCMPTLNLSAFSLQLLSNFMLFLFTFPLGFCLFVFGFFCFLFLKRINDTFTVRFLPTQVCRDSDEIPPSLLPQALNRSNTAIPLTWRQLFQTPSNHCLISQHLSTTGPKAEALLPPVPRSAPPLPLCPPISPNPTSYSRLCCR